MGSENQEMEIYQVLVKPIAFLGGNGNQYLAKIISELPDGISEMRGMDIKLYVNTFLDDFENPTDLMNNVISARLRVDPDNHKEAIAKLDDQESHIHNNVPADIIEISNGVAMDDLMNMDLKIYPFFQDYSREAFEHTMLADGEICPWTSNDNGTQVVIFEDLNTEEFVIYHGIDMIKNDDYSEVVNLRKYAIENPFVIKDKIFNENGYYSDQLAFCSKTVIDAIINPKNFEKRFLDDFKQEAKNENLFYNDDDLNNFHTSMRSDGMVILAGLSGTGKSQLVKCYGNALKLPEEQIKFVSVESNWTDDSDLMGFYDPSNNKYYPGKSELADTLLNAQDSPEKLYIVVFDEMNLSRVEQYFSQFLSVLEMDKDSREITLYNSVNKDEHYPEKIKIGDNVLFVGTINIDESTYKFSDKVLDRSNVIKLDMQNFIRMNETLENAPLNGGTIGSYSYSLMGSNNSKNKLEKSDLELLWDLHTAINKVEPNVGIGWRIVKQINSYIHNLPESIDKLEGLDYQINQRIMTKISGSDQQLAELLGDESDDNKTGIIYEKLAEFLEKEKMEYPDKDVEGGFKKTVESINKKRKDLNVYGYTI